MECEMSIQSNRVDLKAAQTPPPIFDSISYVLTGISVPSGTSIAFTNLALNYVTTDSGKSFRIANSTVLMEPVSVGASGDATFTGTITSLTMNDNGQATTLLATCSLVNACSFIVQSGSSLSVTTLQTSSLTIDVSQTAFGNSSTVIADTVTGVIAFINAPPGGGNFTLSANACTSLDSSAWNGGNASNATITLYGNFDAASIDDFFINLDNGGTANATLTTGGTSASPTSASQAARDNLVANGCAITTN